MNKSLLKTNNEKLQFVILQNKIKNNEGYSLIKIGERFFKVRELG